MDTTITTPTLGFSVFNAHNRSAPTKTGALECVEKLVRISIDEEPLGTVDRATLATYLDGMLHLWDAPRHDSLMFSPPLGLTAVGGGRIGQLRLRSSNSRRGQCLIVSLLDGRQLCLSSPGIDTDDFALLSAFVAP